MKEIQKDSVDWLRHELATRQDKNPAFSMRAFAKLTGTTPGRMSEYLSRKRPLTDRMIGKFINQIVSDPQEHRELKKTFSKKSNFSSDYKLADPQQIATQWYHYAILSLMETSGFKASEKYIAKRLGIPVTKVRAAVDDLVNCKLIGKEGKQWKLLSSNTTTVTDIPSAIIRDSQKTSMRRTIDRLDDIDLNLRDVSSITMAIDSSKIPQAKSAIREFRRSLAKLLETGKQDEVYELNIQLMPMTIKEKE